MTVQQSKRRPLSRYLKDFKHTRTHCAHCGKLLDRITLARGGEIVNKVTLARLDTPFDDASWLVEQRHWMALCRFCGDLHCKAQGDYFDIVGFKQFLFEQTEMSHGTIREYVVRLRRLGNHLQEQKIPAPASAQHLLEDALEAWLPETSSNNYRIALRKYGQFQMQLAMAAPIQQENKSTSDIY